MFEEFDRSSRTKIIRDSQGVPRDLRHQEHVVSRARTAQLAAQEYLEEFGGLLGLKSEEFQNLGLSPESEPSDAQVEYRFHVEKLHGQSTTVSYHQTFWGLPVWEAGLSISMKQKPLAIAGVQTSHHRDIRASKPSSKAIARLKALNPQTLAKLIGVTGKKTPFKAKSLKVLFKRLMIYRYAQSARVLPHDPYMGRDRKEGASQEPILPLPAVNRSIEDSRHYVVSAVDLRIDSQRFGSTPWVALIEAETLSVLYLRPLSDDLTGMVFE